jgi:hypothetical protein
MEDNSWYIFEKSRSHHTGPFSPDQIKKLLDSNKLTDESLLWKEGEVSWKHLKDISELRNLSKSYVGVLENNFLQKAADVPPPLPFFVTEGQGPIGLEDSEIYISSDSLEKEVKESLNKSREVRRTAPSKTKNIFNHDEMEAFEHAHLTGDRTSSFEKESLQSLLPSKEKPSLSLRKFFYRVLFVFALILAPFIYYITGGPKPETGKGDLAGLPLSVKNKLQKVLENPLSKLAMKVHYSPKSQKFYLASNIPGPMEIEIILKSQKNKILHSEQIEVKLEGHLQHNFLQIKEFDLIEGDKIYLGHYDFEVRAKRLDRRDALERLFGENEVLEKFVPRFHDVSENYKYTGSFLLGVRSKKTFNSALNKYHDKLKEKLLGKTLDRLEKYRTYHSLINMITELYKGLLDTSSLKKGLRVFESDYAKNIGPMLQSIILDSNQLSKTLKKEEANHSVAYSKQFEFGKEIGLMASTMLEDTRAKRRLTLKIKKDLSHKFSRWVRKLLTKNEEFISEHLNVIDQTSIE